MTRQIFAIFQIIVICIVFAVIYGILHDQITARICAEYFTVAHPPVFPTKDPTLLGLGWGIIATWWVGALLGIPLALVMRAGGEPRIPVGMCLRPIVKLLTVMGICALLAGCAGWVLAGTGAVRVSARLAEMIPRAKHQGFLTDLFAHNASYGVGFIGGIVVIVRMWNRRRNLPLRPGGAS